MNHGHDIDGMLAGEDVSARTLRLHLDNSHDERTTGWDFTRLHALHQELHGPRLAEIEAAANLIAERLAAAGPAVVEAVVSDRSMYLSDGNGALYLAEPAGVWETADGARVNKPISGTVPLYRLTIQESPAIARGAELARAFIAAGRPKMSEEPAPSDAAGGVDASLGAAPPAPFEHVWTCRLQAGDETCECEEYARS